MNIEKDMIETTGALPVVRKKTPFLGYGLAFFFATAAFFSGMQVGSAGSGETIGLGSIFTNPAPKGEVDMSLFWKVWQTIDTRFVSSTTTEPLSNEERMWGAIEGLVSSYKDPYTVFLPPEDAKLFEADIAGEFSGVGMEVGMKKGLVTVIAPLEDSPAKKAGILSGDVLIKVDGLSTERMGVDEAVVKIRGEKGTKVTLTIFREGQKGFKEISIIRETINIPTLKTEERDGVFIIKLFNFSANSEPLMQDALRVFVKSRKDKLVIDLRGNPGGYLQSAVGIASNFLPTGKIVVRENFGEGKEEQLHRSTGKELGNSKPFEIVVLVDGGSASASEILAGALKDHGVATIMGAHTFGKGSVQELLKLSGGSSLKVTIARWLTPNGVSISNGGLKPDIEVEVTEEDLINKRDSQMDAAIKHLKE